jgi:hypothetical protein
MNRNEKTSSRWCETSISREVRKIDVRRQKTNMNGCSWPTAGVRLASDRTTQMIDIPARHQDCVTTSADDPEPPLDIYMFRSL